jgi:hypothetical protein
VPTLNEILKEDITREIEGVIKADDERRVQQEIREYVITSEIEKLLRRLFEGYAEALQRRIQRSGDMYPFNGVWISGYFGSGKSHLLKNLAYLLRLDADPHLREIFLEKITDSWLRSAVEQAFRTASTSVLFNIDQQADAESTDQNQLILLIFERVFNRALGYCDDDRVIADFERDLDDRGQYQSFQEHFEQTVGAPWREKRDAVMTLDREDFARAWASYKQVDPAEASALLDRYEASRSLTAEMFARRVKEWLDRQADPHHRINFFVDEVGQFVANRSDRMLNLQTVAETLATVCENRAWVFVTSQEDLDSVIGDATQEQRNDFSRITARFHFRLPLTSTNVEEVIQKRLLAKTEEGTAELTRFYEGEADHLRTVFQFGQGIKEVRFKGPEHFALSYPFVAYQYYYLQEALKGLSSHNAFTGRHVSRGERSMLEVFQDVGKQLAPARLFRFATFDQMFDGIRNTLQSGLLQQVHLAEQNILDPLAIRLIKALLMLKYVNDFTTTAEHLTTLMVESLDQNRAELRTQVQQALDTLSFQSYIQRSGDQYEYLTDREKDIEIEIKSAPVEYSEIRRTIGKVVLDKILKTNKITYETNDQPYSFSVCIDEEQYRRGQSDLTMRVITHLHPNAGQIQTLLNQSMGRRELLVVLKIDRRTDEDLRLYHQTQTYLNHSRQTDDPQHQRIIGEKREQNSTRELLLRDETLPGAVESAQLYVADRPLDLSIRDPRQRLISAFQELVKVSFPNLRMLSGTYNESSLQRIIQPGQGDTIFSGDAVGLGEDEAEMQAHLQRRQQDARNTTVAGLKEHFSGGQYGWYEWAILGVIAKLYARDAVELVEGTRVLDNREVLSRLAKAHGHEQITVRLAQPIDSDMVNRLSRFHQEFFHSPATAAGGKELLAAIKTQLLDLNREIAELAARHREYPFLAALKPSADRYKELLDREYRALADTILQEEDELLMEKLERVDKAIQFMNGAGRQTYDRIRTYLQTQRDNFAAAGRADALGHLEGYLETAHPWAGNATKNALGVFDEVSAEIEKQLKKAREHAHAALAEADKTLQSSETVTGLAEEQRQRLTRPLKKDLPERVSGTSSLAALQNITQIRVPETVQTIREEALKLSNPEEPIRYASAGEKRVSYDGSELTTVEDVDRYADALRRHWRALVESGKRIGL